MTKFLLHIPLLVGLLLIPALGWADFQAGVDAYEREDYETAMKEWRPLADQGVALAQNNLGALYQHGNGIGRDYGQAAGWYQRAAEQGNAVAQANLGHMYEHGKGVSRDYVLAHMWLNLAASQGYGGAAKGLEILEKEMTPAQIAEAQRLAREWKPKGK